MSKNLTRKGLAFGALVALGSTVIAGAPAYAVDEIALAPNSGTSYLTTLAGAFVLKAEFGGAVSTSQLGDLRFKIDQTGDKVVSAAIGSDLANGGASYTFDATANSDSTNASFVTDKLATRGGTPADGEKIAAYTEAAAVKLTVSGTATVSANVTAWLDLDNDGVIDSTEYSSATRSVTFHKVADLSAVTTLTAPVAGAASLSASSVITPVLNSAMLANNAVTVDFAGGNAQDGNASFADSKWSATGTVTGNVAGATTYTAQLKVDGTAVGNVASQSVATVTTSTITAAVTDNNDTQTITPAAGTTAKADKVRTGVKSAEVVISLKKSDSTAVAANVPVVVTVTSTAITTPATALVTINGTAAAAVASSITINSVTDANGQVKLAVANQLGTAGDKLTFSATAEGVTLDTNTGAGNQAFELVWAGPTYTVASTAIGGAQRSIVEGGSTTIEYEVVDNFGAAITAASRLKFDVAYTTPATTYVVLNAGKASITVTDTTANVLSAINVDATLQTQDAATLNWDVLSPSVVATQHVVNVTATAVAFDVDPTAASANLDTNVALNAVSVNNAGAPVTISATGVTFTVGGKEYANTVTVFTDANGTIPAVDAKSTVAGAKTVTFTSGSASKTATLTINAAASNSGVTLTVSAPATVVPGQTFTVTGKLVDKWGNPVAVTNSLSSPAVAADRGFSVTYTGPGFVIGGALPTATNAAGEFSFQVLTGAADSGSATVTVTYDLDGSYASVSGTPSNTSAAAISKTATVSIAAPAAPEVKTTIVGVTKAIRVRVENAKGEEVEIVVNGRTVAVATAGTNSKLWVLKSTKGKKSVKVYVDGDLVAVKTVTVK